MKRTGCLFAGSVQNILSMKVVPPNSKTNLLSGLFGTLIIPPLLILQQRVEQCDLCLALMIGSHATHCPSWQFPSNSNLELKHYKGPFNFLSDVSIPDVSPQDSWVCSWRLRPSHVMSLFLNAPDAS